MKDMFEWQGYDCSWMKRNANGYNVIIHIRSMYAQFIFICIFQRKTYHGILVKRQNSFWNGWCWKHKQSKQMNSYKISVSIGSANNTASKPFAFPIFKYSLHWKYNNPVLKRDCGSCNILLNSIRATYIKVKRAKLYSNMFLLTVLEENNKGEKPHSIVELKRFFAIASSCRILKFILKLNHFPFNPKTLSIRIQSNAIFAFVCILHC